MHNNDTMPKYLEIAAQLRERIISGALSGRLPGERELSEQFQVSRITIRKALEVLSAEHCLHRCDRRGAYTGKKQESEELPQGRRIGVIISGTPNLSRFESMVIFLIGNLCASASYRLILQNCPDTASFQKQLPGLKNMEKIDLLLFCGTVQPAALTAATQANIPCVILGEINSSESGGVFDRVYISYYQWGYRATRYLITRGERRIALLAGSWELQRNLDMRSGYRAALEEDGLPFRDNLTASCPAGTAQAALNKALSMIELNHPAAIIAGSDIIAAGVVTAVMQSPEEDIGVVAFNSETELRTSLYPIQPLWLDPEDAASKLWNLIKRRLKHPTAEPHQIAVRCVFD